MICNDRAVPQDPTAEHAVRVLPTAREFRVVPEQNVLAAALAAGLNLPHSCKSGHCGSCRARLIEGQTDYPRGNPLGLTAEESAKGYVLLCQARALTDLTIEARPIRSVEQVDIKTLPARIALLERVGSDVMRVMLRLPAVEHLKFAPGQYLDVLLEGARRRSFSIASPPHDSETLELHVRLALGGGFTEWLFNEARVGSLLKIEGPIGQFAYQDNERPLLLIAGGTGFAPLKSIIRHVLERRMLGKAWQARKVRLYWGVRRAADLYERVLLENWAARHPEFEFTPVLSHEIDAANNLDRALTGYVHDAVLQAGLDLNAHDIYAAGPPAMIEAVRAKLPAAGADPERLYFDSFDYAPDTAAWRR
jgi:CDP-4-dehydro-6-deoxyglucose reductase, E3